MKKIKQEIKKIVKIAIRPEMKILPGNLAFSLFLSLIPIVMLIVIISSIISYGSNIVIDGLNYILPEDIMNVILPYLKGEGISSNVLIFMISGFILASNGPHAIILASNSLYGVKNVENLKSRIKALFLTFILIFVLIFITIILAFGGMILNFIMQIPFVAKLSTSINVVFFILKWPFAILFLYFVIRLLYSLSLDYQIPSKYMSGGAFFTTIGWMIVTLFYSGYVSNFTHYDLFYGSLSNIVVILFWLYILAYIFVLGIAINSNHYQNIKNGK